MNTKITNTSYNYDEAFKSGKQKYSSLRRTDLRIAEFIHAALGNSKTVLNVGAGAGSYETDDRYVIAVEPSASMRSQRIANNKTPAINATADALPFDDNSFDASMALLTVHHWPDLKKGLNELKRVTKDRIVLMTFDPDSLNDFWNAEYFPEVIEIERQRYPAIKFLTDALDGKCEVQKIPIPFDCADGFQEAFYGRPEAFLDKKVRQSQSAWGFLPEGEEDKIVKRLEDDLESGEWDRKYGHFRTQPTFTCALRLIICQK